MGSGNAADHLVEAIDGGGAGTGCCTSQMSVVLNSFELTYDDIEMGHLDVICAQSPQVESMAATMLGQGTGGLLMLVGDAGIGKTRLLHAIAGSGLGGLRRLPDEPDRITLHLGGGDAAHKGQVKPRNSGP